MSCWPLFQVETAGALAHVGAALVLQSSSVSASEVTTALKDGLLPLNSTYVVRGDACQARLLVWCMSHTSGTELWFGARR
jgi:hypothetical protein